MKLGREMAAIATGALLLAGPAMAADYQGVFGRNNGHHVITWAYNATQCKVEFDGQLKQVKLVVDGASYASQNTFSDLSSSYSNIYMDDSIPYHVLATSVSIESGRDYISCGSDRLLFPGAVVAPPAPVPTLSEWAMILLTALLAGGAALTIHRRRQAA